MVSAIVLAAGEGRRMGRPKATLPARGGRTLLEEALRKARVAGDEVIVVLGAKATDTQRRVPLGGTTVVVNRQYRRGMLTSLQAGLRAVHPASRGAFVLLVDLPAIRPATVRALARAVHLAPNRIHVPVFQGQRGHPVYFPRRAFAALFRAPFKVGARWVVRRNPRLVVEHPVRDRGVCLDVDTPEVYRRYLRGRG